MLERNDIPGSKWWKFDFHTHTPASLLYGKGPNHQDLHNRPAREWLIDYMSAGIDCVAITDYNTGKWIDVLKDEYEKMQQESPLPNDFRPLFIFPGVEIIAYGGVHLLAIFDRTAKASDIDYLMGAVDYKGTPGNCNDVTQETLCKVIDKVHHLGGIAIPAHVDDEKGLFKVQHGTTLNQTLDSPYLFAMEVKRWDYSPPAQYRQKHLHWTSVIGSDAHHPAPSGNSPDETYPGARFSWVKMGKPSLDALRLALLDGPLSIIRHDEKEPDFDANCFASQIIESIELRESKYCGRGQPFHLRFNPWMNTIVGGRGTGKSTIIEFLRTVMRREYELKNIEHVNESYYEFIKVPVSRNDKGVLTSTTTVSAHYISENARYHIQWNQTGEDASIMEVLPDNTERHSYGEVARRFPLRIYSQKQIFQLAERPGALLTIIDEDPRIDRTGWNERWHQVENRYLSLRAKAREIQAEIDKESVLKGDLEDLRRKLAIFEASDHGEIRKRYQQTRRQKNALEQFEASVLEILQRLREVVHTLTPADLDETLFNQDVEHERDILELVNLARNKIESLSGKVTALSEEAESIVTEWQQALSTCLWKTEMETIEKEYLELEKRLEREGTEPGAYGHLVQRRHLLEQKLAAFDGLNQQFQNVNQQADECLKSLLILRRELTEKRKQFLQAALASNAMVQMEIIPYGAKEQTEDAFRDIIQKERPTFISDILSEDGKTGILAGLYQEYLEPEQLNNKDFEKKLFELKKSLQSNKLQNVQDQRFTKFIDNLKPEVLDRIWTWFPEDSLEVKYSTTSDRQDFRSIQQGSPGQKTAAILTFLLSYGEEPIILDQPEDDLDNHLIYDLVVRQLRENKCRRQIIVVTHNPNIVVNGDAELVIPMDFREGQCRFAVDQQGEVQPDGLQDRRIREEICRVMEGGREALEKRYNRIAGGSRYV